MASVSGEEIQRIRGGRKMFILGCILAFPIAVLVEVVKMNK